jgi:hypothetical protein
MTWAPPRFLGFLVADLACHCTSAARPRSSLPEELGTLPCPSASDDEETGGQVLDDDSRSAVNATYRPAGRPSSTQAGRPNVVVYVLTTPGRTGILLVDCKADSDACSATCWVAIVCLMAVHPRTIDRPAGQYVQ